MSPSAARWLRGAALIVGIVAWAALAHYGSTGPGPSNFSVALAVAPLAAIAAGLFWRLGRYPALIVGGLLIASGLVRLWPELRNSVELLYFLQHAGTNAALGLLFGRSLFGGGDSLVTQIARVAEGGSLSDLKIRYTRQVTLAWTLFFAVNASLSAVLFVLASPAAWSVFANLLNLPLVGLMFVAEYAVRRCLLPPEELHGIADAIRGYRETMRRRRRRHAAARHP